MQPPGRDERLPDLVVVTPPRRNVNIVVFSGHPADPEINSPTSEEPVVKASASNSEIEMTYCRDLRQGSLGGLVRHAASIVRGEPQGRCGEPAPPQSSNGLLLRRLDTCSAQRGQYRLTGGFSAASKEIKETHPDLSVLVLSQHIETSHAVALVTLGGFGYLLKELNGRAPRKRPRPDTRRRVLMQNDPNEALFSKPETKAGPRCCSQARAGTARRVEGATPCLVW
jgi:hypothetical protein